MTSKRCGCCSREWADPTAPGLEVVGLQPVIEGEPLLLVNCMCGSTLAWRVCA